MTRAAILRARPSRAKWVKTKNGKKYRRNQDARIRKRLSAVLDALKANNPCHDCGVFDYPYLMDFDHTEKYEDGYAIRSIYQCTSWRRLLKELYVVDIVCVRCHRIREHNRRGRFGRHRRKT